ncbi:MAG: hypothetical protein JXR65_01320 [Bacteroidales bacterium]|nr:hypothetical protein [Bacteroidales bacterium]
MSSLKNIVSKGFSKVLLDCDTATLLITKQSLDSAGSMERVQLKMHLAVCSFCREFKKQSEFIHQQIKNWAEIDPDHLIITLSDEQKQKMKEHLSASGAL